MRVHAVGVYKMSGLAKQTGNPFEFAQLVVLVPVEIAASAKFNKEGFGLEAQTVDIDSKLLNKFSGVPFPCDIELTTDQVVGRKGIETVITGFKLLASQKIPSSLAVAA